MITEATTQVRYSQLLEHMEERGGLPSELRPLPLSEFAEEYLRHLKSHGSASGRRKQQYYLQFTILPPFGPDTLTAPITPRKIEPYAEWRRTTVKGTTVNKELACIRCLMREAEEWQHLASKPEETAKELPDDGQVHERFLMDRPALHSSKTEVEAF